MFQIGRFQCKAPGCSYRQHSEVKTCPVCHGLGKPDAGCTCFHKSHLGGLTNAIAKSNPNCPVHMRERKINNEVSF